LGQLLSLFVQIHAFALVSNALPALQVVLTHCVPVQKNPLEQQFSEDGFDMQVSV
jgi:hypothetical protein